MSAASIPPPSGNVPVAGPRDTVDGTHCSFCGTTKIAGIGGDLFVGQGAAICVECVKKAAREELPVAWCAHCTVVDGLHASGCLHEIVP